jgi:hypothetical protein
VSERFSCLQVSQEGGFDFVEYLLTWDLGELKVRDTDLKYNSAISEYWGKTVIQISRKRDLGSRIVANSSVGV